MADKKTSLSPAKNIFKDQRVLLAIVIALIVVIISCINPNFIGINNIVAIFQQICVLGILTMAMSILLISGGIDLSVGSSLALLACIGAQLAKMGLPIPIWILACLALGFLMGVLNGADYPARRFPPERYHLVPKAPAPARNPGNEEQLPPAGAHPPSDRSVSLPVRGFPKYHPDRAGCTGSS